MAKRTSPYSGDTLPPKSVNTWHRVEDKKAMDGARVLKMVDKEGHTIAVIEVMEMGLAIDQAAICAKMAAALTKAGEEN